MLQLCPNPVGVSRHSNRLSAPPIDVLPIGGSAPRGIPYRSIQARRIPTAAQIVSWPPNRPRPRPPPKAQARPPRSRIQRMVGRRVPHDRDIVERFIEQLGSAGFSDLKIDSWPEDNNPGQSVVEAIAGNLAIEHTSVDTLPDQQDQSMMNQYTKMLEAVREGYAERCRKARSPLVHRMWRRWTSRDRQSHRCLWKP